MFLTILGTSAGGPFHGRHYTAQVLQIDNQLFLIDCGEGTQMQLFRYRVKSDRINHIFISHLHGDHVYGLIGMLTGWCLKKRTARLHIFSPPGLKELVETTARLCRVTFPYPLEFHEVDASVSAKIFENQKVEVWTIPLNHRIETAGWLFREKAKMRNIRKEKIEEYDIPYSLIPGIKAGNDLALPDGRIVPNAELTLDPPKPRSFAFCSDTAYSEAVAEVVRGVDLLYHEATFTNEHAEESVISFHSTAAQAAEIARQGSVERLIVGHFSGRYSDAEQHLAEARAVFPETYKAEEGAKWTV
jgi:ribonuclease Z